MNPRRSRTSRRVSITTSMSSSVYVAEVADSKDFACKGARASGEDDSVFFAANFQELGEVCAFGGVDGGDGVGGELFLGEE